MEYYRISTRKPGDTVLWREVEQKYFHPMSIEESCKQYAYSKLSDLISLDDYLTKPNCVVEEMLDGLIAGSKAREEEEARQNSNKSSSEERQNDRLLRETEKMMNQLG